MKRILVFMLAFVFTLSGISNNVYANEKTSDSIEDEYIIEDNVNKGIEYIAICQNEYGAWDVLSDLQAASIGNIIKRIKEYNYECNDVFESTKKYFSNIIAVNTVNIWQSI